LFNDFPYTFIYSNFANQKFKFFEMLSAVFKISLKREKGVKGGRGGGIKIKLFPEFVQEL